MSEAGEILFFVYRKGDVEAPAICFQRRPPERQRPRVRSWALRMQRPDEAERITADILKADPGNARAAHVHGQALLMRPTKCSKVG
jgi:hypothetical protein